MSIFALMAGGTGGHLFPAMALAQELKRRGHVIHLMTDHRATSYGEQFPARETHIIPSATPSGRNPLAMAGAAARIAAGVAVAHGRLGSIRPDAVVGFGGYPIVPPFLAAALRRIPGILHEQNAVMGRANRALGRYAARVALSFAETQYAHPFAGKSVLTGNPIRDRVRDAAATPYPAPSTEGPLRLVVFGGSQGARAFADLVPPAIAALPETLRQRLRIVQQCRSEDLDRVTEAYRQARADVELMPFFNDLPERMAAAHLVIARSGASTIAELTVLGRPAILVPLPGALDGDQRNNARIVAAAGGGWILEQATISPPSLANRLTSLFGDPPALTAAAAAARALGQPHAVERLADLAEDVAHKGKTP